MQLEFSSHIYEKKLKSQVSSKSVQWEQSCSLRTDEHDEANSRFSHFCERAQQSAAGLV